MNFVTAGIHGAVSHAGRGGFWYISWTNVIVAVALHWMAVGFGISMGYHRLHTHRAYKTSKAFEYFFAVCGTMTLEGGPIFWVATHRIHHQKSDQQGDPHSPRDGAWWAHMGWIIFGEANHNNTAMMAQVCSGSRRDPFYLWLNTYHWVPLTCSASILLAFGGLPLVLWGIFLRVVFGLHATWLVNSATHMWGTPPLRDPRRFAQQLVGGADDVRRRLAQQPPRASDSARHGLAWYEFDITWLTLSC